MNCKKMSKLMKVEPSCLDLRLKLANFSFLCEKKMILASLKCLENEDLLNYILTYSHLLDLLKVEGVCRLFQTVVQRHYHNWIQHPDYQFLCYKTNDKYPTVKTRICHIVNNQLNYRGGFYLLGGNFNSLRTATVWIEDNPYEFSGRVCHELPNRGTNGSASYAIDAENRLCMIGGWSDYQETTLIGCEYIDLDEELPNRSWQRLNKIDVPRCFSSATSTLSGDILVTGGGDSPYRGAEVFSSCILKRANQNQKKWIKDTIRPMLVPRCGHGSVTLFNNNIVVIGGYSGGVSYCETVELYDWEKNTWYPLPPMTEKRSGMVSVVGPQGSIYITGGSRDGSLGNKSLERFDPREGKWSSLAVMQKGRGYSSGAVGSSGVLYVCGGLDQLSIFQGGMECYDFKKNCWYGLSGSNPPQSQVTSTMSTLSSTTTNWTKTVFPKKRPCLINQDVLSQQLLRASHQLIYVE
jgi:hypothetical protein